MRRQAPPRPMRADLTSASCAERFFDREFHADARSRLVERVAPQTMTKGRRGNLPEMRSGNGARAFEARHSTGGADKGKFPAQSVRAKRQTQARRIFQCGI